MTRLWLALWLSLWLVMPVDAWHAEKPEREAPLRLDASGDPVDLPPAEWRLAGAQPVGKDCILIFIEGPKGQALVLYRLPLGPTSPALAWARADAEGELAAWAGRPHACDPSQ